MAYTGIYERTIFYNPVNKYSVISVKTSDRSIPEKARSAYRHRDNMIHFAAVGYELPRTDQVSMILDGEWKEGKNGFQLHVTKCEEVVPQTREGIKGYLSSRLIKGIGGKTAELIVDRFGADTLHVLENEPERLLEIRGVSKAKLEEIIASYNESRTLRNLMLLLAPFQITPTTATKIYDHFGAHSVDILRDNPFELCQISGFGFKRVDAIMRKNNWPLNSPMRIRGAVFAALEGAKGDGGHLYLDAEQLRKESMSLLNSMIPVPQMRVKADDLEAVIDDMLLQGKIINSNGNYYLCMCKELQYDVKNSFILFPRELKAAHDSVAKTLKDKRTAEHEKAIAGSFDEWQKRYQYQSKELMMIPPHSAKEIVDEGAALHHCVRLYVKNVAEKKSVILFVRSVDEPDKSLCTVEVKDGQVTQARGFDNEEPPAQITAFIEQWKQRVLYASDKAAA